MSFRSTLQPAKFRGVPFEVSSAETAVGRRVVVHEFPLADQAQSEDLGLKAAEFTIQGFIVGDDYLDGMNRLIAALTAPGPGMLEHPSRGIVQVVLAHTGARLRESFIEKRGMVSFSLTFVDVGENVPRSFEAVDTQQAVENAADAAYGPMEDDFAAQFSIAGAPAWSVQSLTGEIGHLAGVVGALRAKLRFDLPQLSQLVGAATALKANLTGLLAAPRALFAAQSAQLRGLVGLFHFGGAPAGAFGNAAAPSSPLRGLLALGAYGQAGTPHARPVIPTNTPVRRQQAANQAALCNLVARGAVVEAVRSSIYVPFANANDAAALRDTLYDSLDTLMLDAPDPVYAALHDLRGAMVRDITARGADLAQLARITLPASTSARALSYRLYGSGAYADELLERNQAAGTVLHPSFIPGGTSLEVRRV